MRPSRFAVSTLAALTLLLGACVESPDISEASWQLERAVYRSEDMPPDSTTIINVSSDTLGVRLVMGAASGDLVAGRLVLSGVLGEGLTEMPDVDATQSSDGRVTLETTVDGERLTASGSVSRGVLVLTEIRAEMLGSTWVGDTVVLRRVESSSEPMSFQLIVKGLLSHDEWRDRQLGAAMRSDLRNLVVAEEYYFADHTTYTPDKTALSLFSESPGVTVVVTVHRGPTMSYSGIATHADTDITCAIYINEAPVYPARFEGEPRCTVR